MALGLALGAIPALILLIMRLDVPDTALSLIQAGKFKQAKKVAKDMFERLAGHAARRGLPHQSATHPRLLADIWKDPIRKRVSLFAWISNAMQGVEFSAFGFYLPVILLLTGVTGIAGTNFLTAGIYIIATISGFIGPVITPRLGHRGISQWGFGGTFVSLLAAALFLYLGWKPMVPVAAATLMWFHYWSASNGMTLCSMVAPSRYKATASGFGYTFVKLPNFLTIFLFPVVFEHLGIPLATALVSLFSLAGFLAAHFILPEVYGYIEHKKAETVSAA